jgi:hypothetical protein
MGGMLCNTKRYSKKKVVVIVEKDPKVGVQEES